MSKGKRVEVTENLPADLQCRRRIGLSGFGRTLFGYPFTRLRQT